MSAVLVIAPSWVGDMVMAQSLFKLLKMQDPQCAIDVLAPGWTLPLLERMAEVRSAINMPLEHGELRLGVRRRLGISLREYNYAQAIVLPNSLKSALLPFWARIPRRTGYVGEMQIQVYTRPFSPSDTQDVEDTQLLTITVTPDAPQSVDLLPTSDSAIDDDDVE